MVTFLAYYIFGLALLAARDGISLARSNLIFIKHATAVVCVICTVGAYVMGQAQLLRRVALALVRLFPARRYPLTDGDRGRDFVAPVAARGLPTAPTRPHDTPATTSATAAPPPQADRYSSFSLAIQPLLDAIVELRDAQLAVKDEVASMVRSGPSTSVRPPPAPGRPVRPMVEMPLLAPAPGPIPTASTFEPRDLRPAFEASLRSRPHPSPIVSRLAH